MNCNINSILYDYLGCSAKALISDVFILVIVVFAGYSIYKEFFKKVRK